MKIHKKIIQQTPEWFEIKKGKISGTTLKGATGSAKAQLTQMYELLAQEYILEEDLKAWEIMERGNELESIAKLFFQDITGKTVEEVGFIEKNSQHGLSPDGIIATVWIDDLSDNPTTVYGEALEIKCPRGKNYIKYILEDKIPDEYRLQVVNYFIVMDDLETLYFMIYNPDTINGLKKYHIITITRKDLEVDINKANEKLFDFKNRWNNLKDLLWKKD